jgi:hypothetical protein
MIRWLNEMLLLTMLLVPPMIFFPAICWLVAAHPDPTAALVLFWFAPLRDSHFPTASTTTSLTIPITFWKIHPPASLRSDH